MTVSDAELRRSLRAVLCDFPGSTAREIAAELRRRTGEDFHKSDINPILYGKREFQNDDGYVPRWRFVSDQVADIDPPTATTIGIRAKRARLDTAARTAPTTISAPTVTLGAAWGEDWILSELRPWQKSALRAWFDANCSGIVEAVTGTGKTHLGLEAAARMARAGGQTTILVPTVELQRQWRRRLSEFLPQLSVASVGGERFGDSRSSDVTVAVVHTASRKGVPQSRKPRLLIADETHRYGSESWSRALAACYSFRLGLTATLERSGDEGVGQHLLPYFGSTVFHYAYKQAVRENVVAPFRLLFLGVDLGSEERMTYDDLTEKASRYRARLIQAGALSPANVDQHAEIRKIAAGNGNDPLVIAARQYENFLRQRRMLLAECSAKVDALSELASLMRASSGAVVFTQTIDIAEDSAARLRSRGIRAHAVHSRMDAEERRSNLESLEDRSIEVLCAPKILDEGIDIPNIDLGIVMSASSQRRQMIQRLGRVIRLKQNGVHSNFVVLFARDTVEDPVRGAHETFIDMVEEVAAARHLLQPGWKSAEVCEILGVDAPQGRSWLSRLRHLFG